MKQKIVLTTLLVMLSISMIAFKPLDISEIENFTLKDYNGKEHSLIDYNGSKAVVVMFIATKCPVSNAYNSRMASIHKEYESKGFAFLGINSNKAEDADEVKSHAAENGLEFTILKDPNNIIADKFDAKYTPEIYVLNQNREIVYHGRIDDARKESEVEKHDLILTLDAILADKEIPDPETKAFGCTIKRVEK